MLRTFRGRDLLRIGKQLDRAARERAEDAAAPTVAQRAEAAEEQGRQLRQELRRPST